MYYCPIKNITISFKRLYNCCNKILFVFIIFNFATFTADYRNFQNEVRNEVFFIFDSKLYSGKKYPVKRPLVSYQFFSCLNLGIQYEA